MGGQELYIRLCLACDVYLRQLGEVHAAMAVPSALVSCGACGQYAPATLHTFKEGGK